MPERAQQERHHRQRVDKQGKDKQGRDKDKDMGDKGKAMAKLLKENEDQRTQALGMEMERFLQLLNGDVRDI